MEKGVWVFVLNYVQRFFHGLDRSNLVVNRCDASENGFLIHSFFQLLKVEEAFRVNWDFSGCEPELL